jgi:uncharacterized protein
MPDFQRVSRLDLSSLSQTRRTPQGGLIVSARCARTGVQLYPQVDGSIRREYRPPEEVFAPASLDSFRFAPLTIGHPSMVTPDNWRDVAVGHVGPDPKEEDRKFIASDLFVQDGGAASGVEGKRLSELSCGYTCELDFTPGVSPDGQQYDAIQRNIRHNHLALLPPGAARGGPELRVRLDSTGAAYLDGMPPDPPAKDPKDPKDGHPPVTVEVHTHAHDHKHDEKHDHEHDHALYVDAKKKGDALEGEKAVLTGQVTKLTADLAAANDPKRIDGLVAARFALVELARKHLVGTKRADGKGSDPWDPTGKTDGEIRRLVVTALAPDVKLDGKSDDFVAAAFEVATSAAKGTTKTDAAGRSVQGSLPRPDSMHSSPLRTDGRGKEEEEEEQDAVKKAQDGMVQRMKDRGRKDKWPPKDDKHGKDAHR